MSTVAGRLPQQQWISSRPSAPLATTRSPCTRWATAWWSSAWPSSRRRTSSTASRTLCGLGPVRLVLGQQHDEKRPHQRSPPLKVATSYQRITTGGQDTAFRWRTDNKTSTPKGVIWVSQVWQQHHDVTPPRQAVSRSPHCLSVVVVSAVVTTELVVLVVDDLQQGGQSLESAQESPRNKYRCFRSHTWEQHIRAGQALVLESNMSGLFKKTETA